MFFTRFRPTFWRRRSWKNYLVVCGTLLVLLDSYYLVLNSLHPPSRLTRSSHWAKNERIFIASTHWNNEAILRSHWNNALLDLVRYLGPQNVFVSILEGGSWDESKDALSELDMELERMQVPRSVILESTTHKDEVNRVKQLGEAGWISTPRGRQELRRIPYLAKLRNRVLENLPKTTADGLKPFTKILWLNDVVFTRLKTEDVLTLISTNGGNYAAACSLDFAKPPNFYDTFALRDIAGNQPIGQTWPYFLSSVSRDAVVANTAVPVQSCWNGMVVMDATPFSSPTQSIKFRAIPDSLAAYHLEASECCLIHADNPLTASKGVWVNPQVRVAYGGDAYKAVNPAGLIWPPISDRILGMWYNRFSRLRGRLRFFVEDFVVRRRLGNWRTKQNSNGHGPSAEAGENCLINEMQVLVENGWKHL